MGVDENSSVWTRGPCDAPGGAAESDRAPRRRPPHREPSRRDRARFRGRRVAGEAAWMGYLARQASGAPRGVAPRGARAERTPADAARSRSPRETLPAPRRRAPRWRPSRPAARNVVRPGASPKEEQASVAVATLPLGQGGVRRRRRSRELRRWFSGTGQVGRWEGWARSDRAGAEAGGPAQPRWTSSWGLRARSSGPGPSSQVQSMDLPPHPWAGRAPKSPPVSTLSPPARSGKTLPKEGKPRRCWSPVSGGSVSENRPCSHSVYRMGPGPKAELLVLARHIQEPAPNPAAACERESEGTAQRRTDDHGGRNESSPALTRDP